jgi:hypothetical protein
VNVSSENMKNAIIYGSNLASFRVEKFGTKNGLVWMEWSSIKIEAIQIFAIQFDIELYRFVKPSRLLDY